MAPWLRASLVAVALVGTVTAQRVYHSIDDALRLVADGATATRTTVALTDAERARVEELGGAGAPAAMVFPYVLRKDGAVVATVYFDTHRVRSLRETVMVVVTPAGQIREVVLCAFAEPLDYVPRAPFYAQFRGRALDDELRLQRGIDGVTGATLTSRATTDCARRVLALHRVLAERPVPTPPPRPAGGGDNVAWVERTDAHR